MWGQQSKEKTIDELLREVQIGNISDSVLEEMGGYIEEVVARLTTQWINADISKFNSDLSVINFHESYRQAIKAHLLIKTRMFMKKQEGRAAEEILDSKK